MEKKNMELTLCMRIVHVRQETSYILDNSGAMELQPYFYQYSPPSAC